MLQRGLIGSVLASWHIFCGVCSAFRKIKIEENGGSSRRRERRSELRLYDCMYVFYDFLGVLFLS